MRRPPRELIGRHSLYPIIRSAFTMSDVVHQQILLHGLARRSSSGYQPLMTWFLNHASLTNQSALSSQSSSFIIWNSPTTQQAGFPCAEYHNLGYAPIDRDRLRVRVMCACEFSGRYQTPEMVARVQNATVNISSCFHCKHHPKAAFSSI